MNKIGVRPTGIERGFGEDELIVSKTDPRGVITYANDVFLRVAAMNEAATLGKPHNVIRHPDMPRSVFKLLWDALEDRRELFAYVVNLAADGAHYWVFAHVTPSFGDGGRWIGCHSSRRRPAPRAVAEIRTLYDRILAAEQRQNTPREAVAAGSAALRTVLDEAGRTYDELVWEITDRAGR